MELIFHMGHLFFGPFFWAVFSPIPKKFRKKEKKFFRKNVSEIGNGKRIFRRTPQKGRMKWTI